MKLGSKRSFRIHRRRVFVRTVTGRSEMASKEGVGSLRSWKELDLWLLWAGISPEAKEPMSHIGIYTDFT